MIIYNGKINTGFSYAICNLFSKNRLSFPSDPECLSMRSAVYYFSHDSFFLPSIPWNEYMERLILNSGLSQFSKIVEADLETLNSMSIGTTFLLGEVKYPKWDISILHNICRDHNAFLVCKKLENGYEVENPLGCTSMICGTEQILELFIEGKSFIFMINSGIQFKKAPESNLIIQLIDILETYPLVAEMNRNFITPKSSKEKVKFHFGLMSYIQSRYRFCEYFSLSEKVQEQLSVISLTDEAEIYRKIRETELYFIDSLYKVKYAGVN